MMFGLSNALATIWIELKLFKIDYFDVLSPKIIFYKRSSLYNKFGIKWVLEIENENNLSLNNFIPIHMLDSAWSSLYIAILNHKTIGK